MGEKREPSEPLDELDRPRAEAEEEPPVVARLVVEIRSDGSRTIARGAIEDVELGQRTALEIRSGSAFELAGSLVRAVVKLPSLGRAAAGRLLSKALRDKTRPR